MQHVKFFVAILGIVCGFATLFAGVAIYSRGKKAMKAENLDVEAAVSKVKKELRVFKALLISTGVLCVISLVWNAVV